jgi:hypothetical protein
MDVAALAWSDHGANPLVAPRFPRWMIADPSVLLPLEAPDGRWHLFANTIPPRLVEYVSDDGLCWTRLRTLCPGAMRPFVRREGDRWHLLYEDVHRWWPLRSRLVARTSPDLVTWSAPRTVLAPCLPWHATGPRPWQPRTCSNPGLVPWRGEWLLTYSAATVWLPDCRFVEPRHIGVARAASPEGPFVPDPEPLVSPDPADPLRDLGAGSLKLLPDPASGTLWGFTNGIATDADGRSRSAITVIRLADDARSWQPATAAPIVGPEDIVTGSAVPGWKRALVYAMDPKVVGDEIWLYYNARDGWMVGRERIGLAVGRLALR